MVDHCTHVPLLFCRIVGNVSDNRILVAPLSLISPAVAVVVESLSVTSFPVADFRMSIVPSVTDVGTIVRTVVAVEVMVMV